MSLELLLNSTHAEAGAASMRQTFREALITQQPPALEIVEDGLQCVRRISMSLKLASKLQAAVFPLSEQTKCSPDQRRPRATLGLGHRATLRIRQIGADRPDD